MGNIEEGSVPISTEPTRRWGHTEQKLVADGTQAFLTNHKGAEARGDGRVPRSCFNPLLSDTFAKDRSRGELLKKSGLRNTDEMIRYQ